MSKSDGFESDILKLIFNATPIANLADNAGTSPFTTLGVALHTSDPGETGTQTTNEVTTGAYAGYTRINVARTTGGWTVSATAPTQVAPVAAIAFPACTGGTGATITHFSVGPNAGGAGRIYYSGTVTPNITVANGVTPQLTTASTITED